MYLPVEQKTIKPQQVGGFAGGIKYIVNNMLFKFGTYFAARPLLFSLTRSLAMDVHGLYGSDEVAAKVNDL